MSSFGRPRGFASGRSIDTSPKKLVFSDNYDGSGKSRKVYSTDGAGASQAFNGTIDYLIVYSDDPRYLSKDTAPEVLAIAQAVPYVNGDKTVLETDVSEGSIDVLSDGSVAWFVLKNTNDGFSAIGTMKVQAVA